MPPDHRIRRKPLRWLLGTGLERFVARNARRSAALSREGVFAGTLGRGAHCSFRGGSAADRRLYSGGRGASASAGHAPRIRICPRADTFPYVLRGIRPDGEWLEKTIEQRDPYAPYWFACLRTLESSAGSSGRFPKLAKMMNSRRDPETSLYWSSLCDRLGVV